MGNWNISIYGHGCHHNNRADVVDADVQAKEFVEALKKAGHTVERATFTVAAEQDLLPLKDSIVKE